MELTFQIFSANIQSLLSIYNDANIIKTEKEKVLADNAENWTDDEFENFFHYKFHFDWLLLQSLFISSFSYFESFMRSAALYVEKHSNSNIKLDDIKGNGMLDTYRKYIFLVGEIQEASSDKAEWRNINEFKEIRNMIVHNNNKMKKDIPKIITYNAFVGEKQKIIRIKDVKFLEEFNSVAIEYMRLLVNPIEYCYAS